MLSLEHSYSILGVTPKASLEEIKQAYRKLVKFWHPDRFYHDPSQLKEAEIKFKEIVAAYERLKDGCSNTIESTTIRTKTSDPYSHYQTGVSYAEEDNYQEAINEFTRAINLDPNLIKAYQYRGFILAKLGFEHRAKADFGKAEKLKQENVSNPYSSVTYDINSKDYTSSKYSQNWKLYREISFNSQNIREMVIHPELGLIFTTNSRHLITQWNSEQDTLLNTLGGHSQPVCSMLLSLDGNLLISGSSDKTIMLWDLANKTSKVLGAWRDRHTQSILALALDSKQRVLLSGSEDKTIKIWHLDSNYEPYTIQGHKGSILALAITPDENQFASGGLGHQLRIHELETGKLIRSIKHPSPISSLTFSKNGELLATGGTDGTIRLWQVATGNLEATWQGHLGQISSIYFSDNDTQMISSSWDRSIKIWDLATQKENQLIDCHLSKILTVSLSKDEKTLVTGSSDGSVRIWQRRSVDFS